MTRANTLAALVASMLVLAGCPKSKPSDEDAGFVKGRGNWAPSPAADGGARTGVIPDDTGATDAGAAATTVAAASYAGKYSVSAGTMYVPAEKDWASVKFKNDDSKHLGDGEIKLAVDPTGRVSGGTEAGPLGASVIEGLSEAGVLTATIRRKDPTDDGLTGTLIAKITGDAIEGTMKLAEFNAAVVRTATLTAKKN